MRVASAVFCAVLFVVPISGRAEGTGFVTIHPIFRKPYTCAEHWEGNLPSPGDALGSDCAVQQMVDDGGRLWMRSYRGDGQKNEDWFAWNQEVLSPCTCEVVRLRENRITNEPGILGKPPASSILLKRDDGIFIVLAHVQDVRVTVGDRVEAGQTIAKVGNNGMARHPHIHIGAWKDKVPLQLRFDLHELGRLLEE